jgi:hypothetical protein
MHFLTLKMREIVSSETLVFSLNQRPGNYPKEDNFNTLNHGESLKFNREIIVRIPVGGKRFVSSQTDERTLLENLP